MHMRTITLSLTVLAATTAVCGAARAETIAVDDQVSVVPSSIARPEHGMTMQSVEAKFGAPQTRHEAVGTPPITRWDYAQFSVFFEKNLVIDTVVSAAASSESAAPAESTASTP